MPRDRDYLGGRIDGVGAAGHPLVGIAVLVLVLGCGAALAIAAVGWLGVGTAVLVLLALPLAVLLGGVWLVVRLPAEEEPAGAREDPAPIVAGIERPAA